MNKKEVNPKKVFAVGVLLILAGIYMAYDFWVVYRTGVEVTGTVVEYVPSKNFNGKVEHVYIINSDYGSLTKRLDHEKVKIGSEITYIISDGGTLFEEYDMAKTDSYFTFIRQKNWWVFIVLFVSLGGLWAWCYNPFSKPKEELS
ncbi:MAG: hypothetical protein COC04_02135 [Gammaproteobacteria bacterium]|nr:hypothetical protein [Colwellia sp.]PCH65350.1 MAG: hypothetical protein COC04_02135 [Gammaproteobacteria bacterium]